jgi:hypothetical protein
MHNYGSTPSDFRVGQRVEISPHFDLWMRGARCGAVVKIGRERVHVRLDLLPGRALRFSATDLIDRS